MYVDSVHLILSLPTFDILVNLSSPGLNKDARHKNIGALSCTEGWVGHPLDPIGCLFDTLLEASTVKEPSHQSSKSQSGASTSNNSANNNASSSSLASSSSSSCEGSNMKYQHVMIPGGLDRYESYLTQAMEVALMGKFCFLL